MYLIKSPIWLRRIAGKDLLWQMPADESKKIYLSFDDGPHPAITPTVLQILKTFNAKASFFCIGDNVVKYPQVYEQLLAEGHTVGNHTFNHLNGWKTKNEIYIDNINKAKKYIKSSLFRPPYGRITKQQQQLIKKELGLAIVMWDVLSGDFDAKISAEVCANNVIKHTEPGSIIVFHDSEKAWPRLEKALPTVMTFLSEAGYQFSKL